MNIILLLLMEWATRNKRHGLDLVALPIYVRYFIYLVFAFILFAFGGQTANFIYFQF